MPNPLSSLLRRGAIDTLVQIAATTGVRMALVLSIFVLAAFVSPSEIGVFDLFVVTSSILLIFMTLGLDSALAIVSGTQCLEEQARYLWLSLLIASGLIIFLYFPMHAGLALTGQQYFFGTHSFSIAYFYAAANGLMTLIFAFYRWLGKAVIASIIIVASNILGFIAAFLSFAIFRTIDSFTQGLLLGSFFGLVASLFYVTKTTGSPSILWQMQGGGAALRMLVRMAWPFGVASAALIGRRAIDRGVILAIGTPTLLGSYALVSRSGELLSFFLSLPALGFAPIILREYSTETGQKLARLLYSSYVAAMIAIVLITTILWQIFGAKLLPSSAHDISSLTLPLLVANLFFGETTLAGFGFVIAKRTLGIGIISIVFVVVNLATAVPLLYVGYKMEAVAAGFLTGSLVHSSLLIFMSERHVRFGYPLGLILLLKIGLFAIGIYLLFSPMARLGG